MKPRWRKMGSTVTVHAILDASRRTEGHGEKKCNKRVWTRKELDEPRAGWLVGYRTVFEGTIEKGFSYGGGYYSEPDGYEPPYLAIENSIPCVLVAFTPYRKPVHVPLNGYIDGGTPVGDMPPQDRKSLSEESKSWPRDPDGRWSK